MTDARMNLRVDALIRRLEAPARPDETFVTASLAELLPDVRRARRQDSSAFGRLRRDVVAVAVARIRERGASPRRVALGAVMVLIALVLIALLIVVVGSRRHLPPPFGLASNGRIALVIQGHIYTADLNGADRRQLTFGPGAESEPTFSPDGTRMAYRRWAQAPNQGPVDVIVADADGSHLVVIAPAVNELSHIAWSPDSAYVAFSGAISGGPQSGFVAPADGSAPPTSFGSFGGSAWDPTWAPDGKRLAIAADAGLYVVTRDGSDAQIIVVNHGHFKEIGNRGDAAEWSPDGTSLVFTAIDEKDSQGVYLVRLNGAPERKISGEAFRARDATFSPDGTKIAYMRSGTGLGPKVSIADGTSGVLLRVLPGNYAWYQPIWSPDGTKVLVTDDRPGSDDQPGPAIRVILDAIGKEPPVIIPAPGITPDDVPDWAASWQRIATP